MFNFFKKKKTKGKSTTYISKDVDVPPVNKYQHLIDKYDDKKKKSK